MNQVKREKHMKTKLILLLISSSLLQAAPALRAQDTGIPASKQLGALENDRFSGERHLLPPNVEWKLNLTGEQKAELKPIEDDFAGVSKQYQTANQARIDAALEANRLARASKDSAQIQTARRQMQEVWAGLQPYRVTAVNRIKPLLTPDQLTILEDPKNQWHENHAHAANDPSAN
jgi:Spy/CpxP family protein refolding chaperone